ncbi:MAG: cytochrome c [Moraxella sp.]|nr:cytochrome c [Moraxella sp.]
MKKYLAIALTALALTACGDDKADSSAQTDSVKTRQNLMRDWRGANDIMKGMMENPTTFDSAVFKEQADFINKSNEEMWSHFNDQNAKGRSKDEVWTNIQGFTDEKDKFMTASANLVAQADSAKTASDVEQAFGKMAESCGSCHKAYKK